MLFDIYMKSAMNIHFKPIFYNIFLELLSGILRNTLTDIPIHGVSCYICGGNDDNL